MKVTIETGYIVMVATQIELPEGKIWDNVEDFYVKWGTLDLRFKDGSTIEHDCGEPNADADDFKRPDHVHVFAVKEDGETDYNKRLDEKE